MRVLFQVVEVFDHQDLRSDALRRCAHGAAEPQHVQLVQTRQHHPGRFIVPEE